MHAIKKTTLLDDIWLSVCNYLIFLCFYNHLYALKLMSETRSQELLNVARELQHIYHLVWCLLAHKVNLWKMKSRKLQDVLHNLVM